MIIKCSPREWLDTSKGNFETNSMFAERAVGCEGKRVGSLGQY